MTCPRCKVSLHQRFRAGVIVDVCPQCQGLWLDGGELDQLLARLIADLDADAADDEDGVTRPPNRLARAYQRANPGRNRSEPAKHYKHKESP
ncbi:MAG: zf-TFIIB domain-containing protein [Kofleriaceae bacterium]|nr:zf-TFIIB domain-containing protein [Kofleriaceae bacterium]